MLREVTSIKGPSAFRWMKADLEPHVNSRSQDFTAPSNEYFRYHDTLQSPHGIQWRSQRN